MRGPRSVTSPAPIVRTRSPGLAIPAMTSGTVALSWTGVTSAAGPLRGGDDQLAGDAGDRVLAGRVDVEDDRGVGEGQRVAHLLAELLGAGEQVGLEDDEQARATGGAAHGLQVGGHLRGVVRVRVDDLDARGLALELEAAADAGVGGEGLGQLGRVDADAGSRRRGPRRRCGRSGGRGPRR